MARPSHRRESNTFDDPLTDEYIRADELRQQGIEPRHVGKLLGTFIAATVLIIGYEVAKDDPVPTRPDPPSRIDVIR